MIDGVRRESERTIAWCSICHRGHGSARYLSAHLRIPLVAQVGTLGCRMYEDPPEHAVAIAQSQLPVDGEPVVVAEMLDENSICLVALRLESTLTRSSASSPPPRYEYPQINHRLNQLVSGGRVREAAS